jgi:regulator of protease activity HflC (stomatin/prohibitin superfamily)
MNYLKDTLEYIINLFQFWVIIDPWEIGLRVRMGKTTKVLGKGVFFKIPYFDSVYVQSTRLRVSQMPVQTVTTMDNKTLVIDSVIAFSIVDAELFYNTLNTVDATIAGLACSCINNYVTEHYFSDINTEDLEGWVNSNISVSEYGIKFEYLKLTSFANVRTYRLIQDTSWIPDAIDSNERR